MGSDRELLQQALEALEMLTDYYDDDVVGLEIDAITALRARLAQPEPEPVAWINEEQTIGPDYGKKRLSFEPYYSDNPLHYKHTPLYAAPPPALGAPEAWKERFEQLKVQIERPAYDWARSLDILGKCRELIHKPIISAAPQPPASAPPTREWVDLTDEDKQDLYSNWGVSLAAMHFVSERLKAKNGGTE